MILQAKSYIEVVIANDLPNTSIMLITRYKHMLLQQHETSICLISLQSLINISNTESWNETLSFELQKCDYREQVSNYHAITHQPCSRIYQPTVALTMIEWAVFLWTHYTISNWDKSQSFAAGGCNCKDLWLRSDAITVKLQSNPWRVAWQKHPA